MLKASNFSALLVTPTKTWQTLVIAFAIALGLWANVTRQGTDYGTGKGKFADQVDSFSEYLIRNSVLHVVLGLENRAGSLIITKGYPENNYAYESEGAKKYYSNRGAQIALYLAVANIDRRFFIENQLNFFQLFRFINCLLLVACVLVFFTSLVGQNLLAIGALFAFSISGGVALFCSNLYFAIWLLFSPLICFPLLRRSQYKTYVALALVLSIAYFSARYEFATTFALMWTLPILVNSIDRAPLDYKLFLATMGAVCMGFIAALVLHHVSVANEQDVTLSEASSLIFTTLKTRVASFEGVPPPFSLEFVRAIFQRWNWAGFSFPLLFSITKFACLAAFVFVGFSKQGRRNNLPMLFAWAGVAYASWYVFGYQHIMWHAQYDSLLFVSTIQLAFLCYLLIIARDKLKNTNAN